MLLPLIGVRGWRVPRLVLSRYSSLGFVDSETRYFIQFGGTFCVLLWVRAKKAAMPQASALVIFDPHRFTAFKCPAPSWQSRQSIEPKPRNVVATRTAR